MSDLTGELMRFAITAIGRRAGRQIAREVCDFVRNCKAGTCVAMKHDRLFSNASCFVLHAHSYHVLVLHNHNRLRGFHTIRETAREKAGGNNAVAAENRGRSVTCSWRVLSQAIESEALCFAAAYAIAVRVSEYGGSETILDDIVERCVSGVKRRRNEVGEREDVADFGDEV